MAKLKRPKDVNQLANLIGRIATGEIKDKQDKQSKTKKKAKK